MAEIFRLTHESNDFSEYSSSSTGNDLTTGTAAGMVGTYGIIIDADVADTDFALKTISGTFSTYARVGFYFNKNSLATASDSNTVQIILIEDSLAGSQYFDIQIIRTSGSLHLQCISEEDGPTSVTVDSGVLSSGSLKIEILQQRASSAVASDGVLTLYIDDVQKDQVTGIDNFDIFPSINGGHLQVYKVEGGPFTGSCWVDEIVLRDDSTAIFAADDFRLLGLAADNGTLLVTGLKNAATLQLFEYSDLATLTESGTTSFGSATDTELDNLTRGIFPVVRPEGDGVWYLYGRDGNNVQAQYNDTNGTLGWVDIGPGTATWGTAKYAVALMPAPTEPNDVIIAFQDDDIYRARYGTATWVKMGDATSGLRTAVRHPVRFNELLAGGTAAGTVWYSHNFGVSWTDVGGTAMGTINAFEVSL